MEKSTVLVTGATNGIGLETAKALARQDMRVIIGCRDKGRGEKVLKEIRKEIQDADIHLGPILDLSKPDSIRNFVEEYKYPLHILVNNAGMNKSTGNSYTSTIPEIIQVNYLGPFLLTLLMEDKLIKHAGLSNYTSRVVNVSSVTHRFSDFGSSVLDNNELSEMFRNDELHGTLYPATKLANVLFTSYMSLRWRKAGVNVHSVAVDPGSVITGIWKNSKWENSWLLKLLFSPASDGAQAVIHAATVNFDKEKNIDSISLKKDMARLANTRPKEFINYIKEPKNYPDFRFYARGAFSWNSLTKIADPGTWRGYLHALIDWPLRNISRFNLANETVPVRANLVAYNHKICEKFFQASAKFVGLREDQ